MDRQSEKNLIIERLMLVNDDALIEMVKRLLDYGLKNQEGRISIEQYNKEIEEAEVRIKNGLGVSHEEVLKQIKKW